MNTPPGIAQNWYETPGPQAYLKWTDFSGATRYFWFDLVESESWTEDAEVTEHPVEVGANIGDHVRVKLVKCELKIFSTNEPIDQNVWETAQQTNALLPMPSYSFVPDSGVVIVPEWNSNIDLRALAGSLVGLAGGLGGGGGAIAGLAITALADVLLPGFKTYIPTPTNAGLTPQAPAGAMQAVVQTFSGTDFVYAVHAQMLFLKNSAQIVEVIGTKGANHSMVIESLSFMRDMDTGTGEALTIGFIEIRVVSTQVVTAPIPHLSAGGGKPPVSHGAQAPTPFHPTGPQFSAAFAAVFGPK